MSQPRSSSANEGRAPVKFTFQQQPTSPTAATKHKRASTVAVISAPVPVPAVAGGNRRSSLVGGFNASGLNRRASLVARSPSPSAHNQNGTSPTRDGATGPGHNKRGSIVNNAGNASIGSVPTVDPSLAPTQKRSSLGMVRLGLADSSLSIPIVSPLFISPITTENLPDKSTSLAEVAAVGIVSPNHQHTASLVEHIESLPPYTDSEFSAQAASWTKFIHQKLATPILPAGTEFSQLPNADGFTPRTANLLDRSWLLPERLSKRLARSYQTPAMEMSKYQTKQFREIFGQAAIGEASRITQRLKEKVEWTTNATKPSEPVQVKSTTSAILRPHMSSKAPSPALSAAKLTRKPPLPNTLLKSSSQPQLPVSSFHRHTDEIDAPPIQPTLVSKHARIHSSTLHLGSPTRTPKFTSLSTAASTSSPVTPILEESKSQSQFTPRSSRTPKDSLLFADLTGTKPKLRPLNKAPRVGDTLQSTPTKTSPVKSSTPTTTTTPETTPSKTKSSLKKNSPTEPPARRPPLNSLKAEEDPSTTEIEPADDDSISDLEVDYDSLLDTDDSEEGLDELVLGVRVKKPSDPKHGKKYNSNSQFSASMLVLNGVPLPEWPHTVASEDELEDEDNGSYLRRSNDDNDDDLNGDKADDDDDEYQNQRRKKSTKLSAYAIAASREERGLQYLASGGGQTQQLTTKPKLVDPDFIPEPNCIDQGKRIRLVKKSKQTELDNSLRTVEPGFTVLDRVAVISAENHIKKLAKEALRNGGRYAELNEEEILQQLEADRLKEEERLKKEMGLDRIMPEVVKSSLHRPKGDLLHVRHLSELTFMQQKNLSDKEMQWFQQAEKEAAMLSDGSGGTITSPTAAQPSSTAPTTDRRASGTKQFSFPPTSPTAATKEDKRIGPLSPTGTNANVTPTKDESILDSVRSKSSSNISPGKKLMLRPSSVQSHVTFDEPEEQDEEPEPELPPETLVIFREDPPLDITTDEVIASEPLPLTKRPEFHHITTFHSTVTQNFPKTKKLPTIHATAHLRPPKALGTQVERWLKKHGQVIRRKLDPDELAKYRSIFNLLDEDGSGTLSLTELQSALSDINVHMSLQELSIMSNEIKAESLRTQSIRRRNLINFDEFVNGLARAGEWDTLMKLADERKLQVEKYKKRQKLKARQEAELKKIREAEEEKEQGRSKEDRDADDHRNPFMMSRDGGDSTNRTSRTGSPSPGRRRSTDIHPLLAEMAQTPARATLEPLSPTAQIRNIRTSRSSISFGAAPLIGGAGLVIDSMTGASVNVPSIVLSPRALQRDEPVTRISTERSDQTNSTQDTTRSPITFTHARASARSTTSTGSHKSNKSNKSNKLIAVKSAPTIEAPQGVTSLQANTSDLLPFTLWVPAFNRSKKIASLMQIESVSDAQLQAMIDEDRLEMKRQVAIEKGDDPDEIKPEEVKPLTVSTTAEATRAQHFAPPAPSNMSHKKSAELRRTNSTFISVDELWEEKAVMTPSAPIELPGGGRILTASAAAIASIAAGATTAPKLKPSFSELTKEEKQTLVQVKQTHHPPDSLLLAAEVARSLQEAFDSGGKQDSIDSSIPDEPLSPTAGLLASGRTDPVPSIRLNLEHDINESSQSLPFLWRQTQENIRVTHLQHDATKAKADFEALVSSSLMHAREDPNAAPADPLAHLRAHALAKDKALTVFRELEPKRVTHEIFEGFAEKLPPGVKEPQEGVEKWEKLDERTVENTIQELKQKALANEQSIAQATASSKNEPIIPANIASASNEKVLFSRATLSPTGRGGSTTNLDFIGGARARAQQRLEATRQERELAHNRSASRAVGEIFGEMELTDPNMTLDVNKDGSTNISVTQAIALGVFDMTSASKPQKQIDTELQKSASQLQLNVEQTEREINSFRIPSSSTTTPLKEIAPTVYQSPTLVLPQTDVSDLVGTGHVGVDYTSITQLWSDSAKHIELSRGLLREKEKVDAERVRQLKKKEYLTQAKHAYGSSILKQTQDGLTAEALAELGRADENDELISLGDTRQQQLEWLLFSSTQPTQPDSSKKLRRSTQTNPEELKAVISAIQEEH